MARIFITGSTDGLGRAAARSLIADGHQVVLHARSSDRAAAVADLTSRAAGLVVGDLRSGGETKSIAEQVNAIGRMDAVIHSAGIYSETSRGSTPEGHATILAVNTLAPYLLTALIDRPDRLGYTSRGLRAGARRLRGGARGGRGGGGAAREAGAGPGGGAAREPNRERDRRPGEKEER